MFARPVLGLALRAGLRRFRNGPAFPVVGQGRDSRVGTLAMPAGAIVDRAQIWLGRRQPLTGPLYGSRKSFVGRD
jgi:hypothetical protein